MQVALPVKLLLLLSLCALCLLVAFRLHAAIREDERLRGEGVPEGHRPPGEGVPEEERLPGEGVPEGAGQELAEGIAVKGSDQQCPVGDRRGLFQPGDIDAMFERLAQANDLVPTVLSRDPWLLQLDSFLTPQECDDIVKEVGAAGYHDSLMWSGDPNNNVLWRNSSSFLCQDADAGYPLCSHYPAIQKLRRRMASVLRAHLEHGDGMAILRYLTGGYYVYHHDFIPEESNPETFKNCGPRVMTFMVYLTPSGDEDGGETHFIQLGLKVQPRQGRAILWPDVFSEAPLWKDDRTAHEAMRVHRGTKICATQWFHQYYYSSNRHNLCCD